MDAMDIDSPPESNPPGPYDRVLLSLTELGLPKEYIDRGYAGVVDFLTENPLRLPDLIYAILPSVDEVASALKRSKERNKQAVAPTMGNRYRECMMWLQWMMFSGEPAVKLKILSKLSVGRGVCGAVWGNNDIAYRCRTCELDPTCAICVPCFQNGNHKDHDYSVMYTGGGCCDCGDATAWKREGFCSKHKGAEQIQPLPTEFASSVEPVLDALLGCWKDKLVAAKTSCQHRASDGVGAMVKKKAANELTFAVVELLSEFCKFSESLLSFVSKRTISLDGLLEILVRAERFLSDSVSKKLHELLLKLLAEPIFKYEFAKVFLNYYPFVIQEAIKESNDSAFKKYPLLSTFSVQIFTVPTLIPRLLKEVNLLGMLLGCLGDIFVHCAGEDGRLRFTKWGNLYDTTARVVDDIRFVMTHDVVPKYVIHDEDVLRTWMKILSFLQGMCPLKRETNLHIEEEGDNINLAFALGHCIANIHSHLVDGAFSISEEQDDTAFIDVHQQCMEEEDDVRLAKVGRLSQESAGSCMSGRSTTFFIESKATEVKSDSIRYPSIPRAVTWLIYECLRAMENSLRADGTYGALLPRSIASTSLLALKNTLSKIRKGKSIFGGFASSNKDHSGKCFRVSADLDMENGESIEQDCKRIVSGEAVGNSSMEEESLTEVDSLHVLSLSNWPEIIYDVSSQDVSVHIPLHRLLSLLLQRAFKRCYGESAQLNRTSARTTAPLSAVCDDFFGCILDRCHPYGFSAFILEHPLRNRVFCSEVHAGMWRKNGDAPILSCEVYHSVRWSEQGLELDLFLLQCCAALAPPDLYIKRIVERFGLSEYLSLNPEQSSEYEPVLVQEMLMLIIQIVQERRFSGLTLAENLKRELVRKLAIGDATHSQLVKSLPYDLSNVDQLQDILDTVAVYSNPSGFNQGMYSLRWTYWKELDMYHPRWNPKDLQVAEERYVRYCSASAWTTLLPRWTKIYPPLNNVARIATCKVVLQIIHAVLFYAVFTEKLVKTRAPDFVVLMALHLLSLALDICFQHRETTNVPFCTGEPFPILAFAGEEICEGLSHGAGEQSLLSLLVSMLRMHKRENVDYSGEAGSYNISSLIESLLKKFAEMDSGCMAKLQLLAPEVVIHLSQGNLTANTLGSASDSQKRKAKAQESQAAILAKMKADQSKFLSSINSFVNDDSNCGPEESNSNDSQDLEESAQHVCSLCRDPNSKNPVSFLILLQRSRLLSFVDRGPISWDQIQQSNKGQVSAMSNNVTEQSGVDSSSSGSGVISSTQLSQLLQNVVNEFAEYAQPGEVNAIVEFFKAQFPLLSNTQVPLASKAVNDRTAYTVEQLEQEMYLSIWKEMHDNKLIFSSCVETENLSVDEAAPNVRKGAESVLLGKYLAALSREMMEYPSASERSCNDGTQAVSTSQQSTYKGLGPIDCDGVHLSSCGHAVHQECLDRYLSSLKERFVQQIGFEGGHIVDPDQGEFLCPVCRQLANSVLPSLLGDFQKIQRQPMISTASSECVLGPLATSGEESNFLWFQQALSVLKSAAKMVEKGDILKSLPLQRNERMGPNLDAMSRLLSKLYFSNRQDKFWGYTSLNHPMIIWDTLKYSLVSMEITARCGRNSMTPTYGLNALYSELKSSSGFTLLLLLKIVQSLRNENSVYMLQKFRAIQSFAESICSGASMEYDSFNDEHAGNISCILKHIEKEVPSSYTQFWDRAADPVLARDPFSTLMWVLFCLPQPFLSCEQSLLSLVHLFYIASLAQAMIIYCGRHQYKTGESGFQDSLIADIFKVVGESGWILQYFVSKYADSASDITDIIRRLSFPYLRRCALLWKLLSTSVSNPFYDCENVLNRISHGIDDITNDVHGDLAEHSEVQELENMFKIPPLDVVIKDKSLRSLVLKWLHHFCESDARKFQSVLHITPAVPFKLMDLPHIYQDLLERYMKQRCADCKNVLDVPALCLLCGRLCSPNWKSCCRDSGCQTHAMACGAGIGVFLLIKRTIILLQRCARQAPWPSPYLDAFGEEDISMYRGKPLYLNEERYAALAHMVASHGLDRSSKVLGQTTIGFFFLA